MKEGWWILDKGCRSCKAGEKEEDQTFVDLVRKDMQRVGVERRLVGMGEMEADELLWYSSYHVFHSTVILVDIVICDYFTKCN